MKKIFKPLIIIVIIVIAVFAFLHYRKTKNKPEWRTDSPSTGTIREVVTATGSLNPNVSVNVGTEVSGTIQKIYVDFNSIVRKGQLLAKLDTEILETNLEATKSDVAKSKVSMEDAKLDLDLLKDLVKKNMAASYDLQKAQFKYDQAVLTLSNSRISMQRAEKNLQNASIKSPIDGVIVSRSIDEGQTVASSFNSPTLFIIANNLEQMQITANVDEADIGKVQVKMPVEFSVDAYPDQAFNGNVKQIRLNPSTDSNVVSYAVIIDAHNPDKILLPGMTANVTIVIQEKEGVLRIPESAGRFKPSKEVWTLFGLKWDDKLLENKFKRNGRGMGQNQAHGAQTPAAPEAATAVAKSGRPNLPDSIKTRRPAMGDSAKFAMRKGGNRGEPATMERGQRRGQGQGQSSSYTPRAGVSKRGSRKRMVQVWILKNGVPSPKMVQVGLSDGAFVEVLEGIAEGDVMVTGVIYKNLKQAGNAASPMSSGPGMGRRF
ncbi:MAG: efflux RND transporter periplasmic adaptor subunit [Candidatus Cloacimonetes bacterium HGW-Cloacimonetes-1]|jgi:HlyD family secretion protein|nr:MAG: efflux RND transporter periplasmic adaptor subunit [Candidatus Cloacimonetes bacterium HGW-Cloacimonetes-1]